MGVFKKLETHLTKRKRESQNVIGSFFGEEPAQIAPENAFCFAPEERQFMADENYEPPSPPPPPAIPSLPSIPSFIPRDLSIFKAPPRKRRKKYKDVQEKKEALRLRSQENRKRAKARKLYTEQRLAYLEQENQKLKQDQKIQRKEIAVLTDLLEKLGVSVPPFIKEHKKQISEGISTIQAFTKENLSNAKTMADEFFTDLGQGLVEIAEVEEQRAKHAKNMGDQFLMELGNNLAQIAENEEQKVNDFLSTRL